MTSVLKPPAGASFEQLLTGKDDERIILASSAGYGFINTIGNLDSNQKAGKNIINFASDKSLLPVARIDAPVENTANSEDNDNTIK
ncbi:hypothetical protein, partial [Pseudomonas sp. HY2-MNA-CIBAN-0224]|uniref:hypothetical protein n=1 Tax=Pseudomonas sp. HY2-MNA-CIBAN-0224 TaxID=3140471 RepID=UPI0033294FF6